MANMQHVLKSCNEQESKHTVLDFLELVDASLLLMLPTTKGSTTLSAAVYTSAIVTVKFSS